MTFDSFPKSSFIRIKSNVKKCRLLHARNKSEEEAKKDYHFRIITPIFRSITDYLHYYMTRINPFSLPFNMPKEAWKKREFNKREV